MPLAIIGPTLADLSAPLLVPKFLTTDIADSAGYRNVSRARKGAVAQNGTAASNSLSRMPGSWSGINNPTGFEVGRKCPCLQKSEFTRNEKSELDFNALIRGHVLCRQHEGRRPHLQTDLTYL
jgi:hypothetical protein